MAAAHRVWVAILALFVPAVALIHAAASWSLAGIFAALAVGESAILTFAPPDGMVTFAALLLGSLAIRVLALVLTLRAERRWGAAPLPWPRRWYALPLWIGLLVAAMPDTWLGAGYDVYIVPSASMEPTLQIGERFFAHAPELGPPGFRRGEVVVFRGRTDREVEYVKRIIGLPGDRVRLLGGVLHLNGTAVPRERIGAEASGRTRYREQLDPQRGHDILEVTDDGQYDNTADFLVPDGHLFMLGDNRDDSLDSRATGGFGFVPFADVTARARFILWGPDRARIGTRLN